MNALVTTASFQLDSVFEACIFEGILAGLQTDQFDDVYIFEFNPVFGNSQHSIPVLQVRRILGCRGGETNSQGIFKMGQIKFRFIVRRKADNSFFGMLV